MFVTRQILIGLVALAIAPLCGAVEGGLLLSDVELRALQSQPAQSAALIARCEKEIELAPSPVTELSPPDHYGPSGVVKLDKPLTLGPDGQVAYRAALCFALSGDAKFAAHSQQILNAWSGSLRTIGSKQGYANVNFDLPYYVIAAGWVRGAGQWDDTVFRRFLRETILPVSNAGRENNHGNWGVLLEASIGAYLADRTVLERARDRWQALMTNQVAEDGSLPLEICRSDTSNYCGGERKGVSGLSYTHYALLPTTLAAKIFDRSGLSVWDSPAGGQLKKAFVRAAAWVQRPDTFPYYSPERELHGVRNIAYFQVLQRHYPNEVAAQVLADERLEGTGGFELPLLFGRQPKS